MNKFCLSFADTKGKCRQILVKIALDQLASMGFTDSSNGFTRKCLAKGSVFLLIGFVANDLLDLDSNIEYRETFGNQFSVLTQYNEFIAAAHNFVESAKTKKFTVSINVEVTYKNGEINYNETTVDGDILKAAAKYIR